MARRAYLHVGHSVRSHMVQRDYVLRMIEQFVAALIRLRRLVLERHVDRAELDRDLRRGLQIVGLDLALARLCDGATLLQMVAPSGEPDPGKCWLTAEVLYLDALDAQLGFREEEARQGFAKARLLYALVGPDWVLPGGVPEAAQRIAEIDERLAALDS